MKTLRHIGSLAFVLGVFTTIFVGVPWHVITTDDPAVPLWLRIAIFSLLGGILLVLGGELTEYTEMMGSTAELLVYGTAVKLA